MLENSYHRVAMTRLRELISPWTTHQFLKRKKKVVIASMPFTRISESCYFGRDKQKEWQ